jgi:hypothetical protein
MRHLLHVLASLAMWCLFGYYWYVVLARDISPYTVRAVIILGVVILVGLVLTVLWIGHNLRVARKHGERRRSFPQTGDPTLERDTIGRPVECPDLATLRRARVVEVTADEDGKRYAIVEGEESA